MIAPNTPAMYEAHFGVPMAGAVLNTINIRLDAATIAFILEHGGAKALLVDREFAAVVAELGFANLDDAGDLNESLAAAAGAVSERHPAAAPVALFTDLP